MDEQPLLVLRREVRQAQGQRTKGGDQEVGAFGHLVWLVVQIVPRW